MRIPRISVQGSCDSPINVAGRTASSVACESRGRRILAIDPDYAWMVEFGAAAS